MDSKLFIRQRSLVFLTFLMHSPANVSQALEENIIPSLMTFLSNQDLTCRQKITQIFYILSNHAIGRSALIQHECMSSLVKLVCIYNIYMIKNPSYAFQINDQDDLVRKQVHDTFSNVTRTKEGICDYYLKKASYCNKGLIMC